MALTLGLKNEDGVWVDDTLFIVQKLPGGKIFLVNDDSREEFELFEDKMVEVLPNVKVFKAPQRADAMIRIGFEAPKEIEIDRDVL